MPTITTSGSIKARLADKIDDPESAAQTVRSALVGGKAKIIKDGSRVAEGSFSGTVTTENAYHIQSATLTATAAFAPTDASLTLTLETTAGDGDVSGPIDGDTFSLSASVAAGGTVRLQELTYSVETTYVAPTPAPPPGPAPGPGPTPTPGPGPAPTPVESDFPVPLNDPAIALEAAPMYAVTPTEWQSETLIDADELYIRAGGDIIHVPDNLLNEWSGVGIDGAVLLPPDGDGYRTLNRGGSAGYVELPWRAAQPDRMSGYMTLLAGSASSVSVGIWTATQWAPANAGNVIEVVSGPGAVPAPGGVALWNVTGLSTTVPTVIRWRIGGTQSYSMRLFAGTWSSSNASDTVRVHRDIQLSSRTEAQTWPRRVRRDEHGHLTGIEIYTAESDAGLTIEARALNAHGRTTITGAGVKTETLRSALKPFYVQNEMNYKNRPRPLLVKGSYESVPVYEQTLYPGVGFDDNNPAMPPAAGYDSAADGFLKHDSLAANTDIERWRYWPFVSFTDGSLAGDDATSIVPPAHASGEGHHANIRKYTMALWEVWRRLPFGIAATLAQYNVPMGANFLGYSGNGPWTDPADWAEAEDSVLAMHTWTDGAGVEQTMCYLDVAFGLRPTIYYRWDDQAAWGSGTAHDNVWVPGATRMIQRSVDLCERHYQMRKGTLAAAGFSQFLPTGRRKPVIPYFWLQYADQVPLPKRHDFLPRALALTCLRTIRDAGASGVILWGGQHSVDGVVAQQEWSTFRDSTAHQGLLDFAADTDLMIHGLIVGA